MRVVEALVVVSVVLTAGVGPAQHKRRGRLRFLRKQGASVSKQISALNETRPRSISSGRTNRKLGLKQRKLGPKQSASEIKPRSRYPMRLRPHPCHGSGSRT